jgi:hypothetical protein
MFLFHDFPSNTNPNFGKIIYRNFACGLHGGVDMTWSGAWRLACFGAELARLWLGLKSAEELCHCAIPPGIDSADQRGFDIGRVQSSVLRLPKY